MKLRDKKDYEEVVRRHPLFQKSSLIEFDYRYSQCSMKTIEKGQILLPAGQKRAGLFLVLEGAAEIVLHGHKGQEEEVLEIIEEGELIGFSSLADFLEKDTDSNFESLLEVKATQLAQFLFIPYQILRELLQTREVKDYLFHEVAVRLKEIYHSLAEQLLHAEKWEDTSPYIRRVEDIMTAEVITVSHSDSVRSVANKMADHNISSVPVLNQGKLAGIVTEKDMVHRVIAREQSYEVPISSIMTLNPVTIHHSDYYYQALAACLTKKIKHLPVLQGDQLVGIITLSDLFRRRNLQAFNMINNIETLDRAEIQSMKEAIYQMIGSLLQEQIPIHHILQMVTETYDRLARRCVQLAVEAVVAQTETSPPVAFCWFQMGSGARGEQLLLTDQDHFLVYEDSEPEKETETNEYFSLLGQEITAVLEEAGYARCTGNMMASNPDWRGSLSAWETRIRQWERISDNDRILQAQNFFSFRLLLGDDSLYQQFLSLLKNQMPSMKIMLYRMAQIESELQVPNLESPIRSLLGRAVKEIDMKKQVLFPFHHAIQILALSHGIVEGKPLEKLKRLAQQHVLSEGLVEDVQYAFNDVMDLYLHKKWQATQHKQQSSSVLSLAQLKTREKDDLVISLKAIRLLKQHMQAEYIR
ncbi:DUF294 nucleotidyltransferase-like domain-containing protein [Pseudalkalibacillus caeni]|nr:DUF294 nucleotidyltransferase-like domain-containing protein [Pseudalkalibacillus caeni]